MPIFQTVKQRQAIDRSAHVWVRRENGEWRCCICGGVTRRPTDDELPERFEPLTDEERRLCPPRR